MKSREEVVRAIAVIVAALHKEKNKGVKEVFRRLGAIESCLITLGVIDLQGELPFGEVDFEKPRLFGPPIITKRKESYKELILRLASETIAKG